MTCLHLLIGLVFVSIDGQVKAAQKVKPTLLHKLYMAINILAKIRTNPSPSKGLGYLLSSQKEF